jgi:hypothetical protein
VFELLGLVRFFCVDGCLGETQIWLGGFKFSVDVGLWLIVRILVEFRGGWINWLC